MVFKIKLCDCIFCFFIYLSIYIQWKVVELSLNFSFTLHTCVITHIVLMETYTLPRFLLLFFTHTFLYLFSTCAVWNVLWQQWAVCAFDFNKFRVYVHNTRGGYTYGYITSESVSVTGVWAICHLMYLIAFPILTDNGRHCLRKLKVYTRYVSETKRHIKTNLWQKQWHLKYH